MKEILEGPVDIKQSAEIGDLVEALNEGKVAVVRGFGTFRVKHLPGGERRRNPKTGEDVLWTPSRVVRFSTSDSFRRPGAR